MRISRISLRFRALGTMTAAVAVMLGAVSILPALAAAPFGRYVLTNETALDVKTRLVWERRASSATRSWSGCLAYCENLDLAGKVDWRLPNAREYVTLLDHSTDPALDSTAFGGEPFATGYHTSSVCQQFNRSVSFSRAGSYEENNNTSPKHCRCARGPDADP